MVPFVKFKKREKHPWGSVNFSEVAGFKPATLLKLTLLHGCFSRFLNYANGTKLRNAPHIFNPFLPDIPFDPLSLEESENQRISDVFRGQSNGNI